MTNMKMWSNLGFSSPWQRQDAPIKWSPQIPKLGRICSFFAMRGLYNAPTPINTKCGTEEHTKGSLLLLACQIFPQIAERGSVREAPNVKNLSCLRFLANILNSMKFAVSGSAGRSSFPNQDEICKENHTVGSLLHAKLPTDETNVAVGSQKICKFGQMCVFWPHKVT